MLKQRIITAIVLVSLALVWLFLLPFTGFALVAALIFLLASREWGLFVLPAKRDLIMLVYGAVLGLSWWLIPLSGLDPEAFSPWLLGILLLGGGWWLLALAMVLRFPIGIGWWKDRPLLKGLFGLLTLVPFFWAMLVLRQVGQPEHPLEGGAVLLFVMALVWCADSGAYFAGRTWGRSKMLPAVSPKKTREGLAGGLVCAGLLAALVPLGLGYPLTTSIQVTVCSLVAVLASVLGDLSESLFKRTAGIKDSGSLLPGHGGILDRVDSLTAALPVFVLCYWLLA